MKLHVWGTDFRRSTPEMRAKLFCSPEAREKTVRDLLAFGFTDVIYLSTCNRVEFYTTGKDYFRDTRQLWLKVLAYFGLGEEDYYRGYHLEGKSALRHLLRVACSLESLVIGEPQILGQLKEAVRWNKEVGFPLEGSLERCFELAFETAKKVRTETSIGEKPVSVATLGLKHLQALEGEYPLKRAVVVGRSPISALTVQWLLKNRPGCPILWVNRNVEALKAIPESAHTELVSLERFLANPPDFSHLFTATSSPDPIFGAAFFAKLAPASRLIFDFAQPPDVERQGVHSSVAAILHLEDLMEEARENTALRQRAIEQAEVMIEESLRDYCQEQKEAPLIRDFNSIEPKFLEELAVALAVSEKEFPPEVHAKLKRWAEKLVKKNLHCSREHLRAVLRKVSEPEPEFPISERF